MLLLMVMAMVMVYWTDHNTDDGDGKDDEIKIHGDGRDNPIFQACHWSGYAG